MPSEPTIQLARPLKSEAPGAIGCGLLLGPFSLLLIRHGCFLSESQAQVLGPLPGKERPGRFPIQG